MAKNDPSVNPDHFPTFWLAILLPRGKITLMGYDDEDHDTQAHMGYVPKSQQKTMMAHLDSAERDAMRAQLVAQNDEQRRRASDDLTGVQRLKSRVTNWPTR